MPHHRSRVLPLFVLVPSLALGALGLGHFLGRRTPVVCAVEHASRAVVSVDAAYSAGRGLAGRSSGAGVIVHPDGYVVTNSHVVRGGTRIQVDLFGTKGRLPARVVADDPAGDLAVLRIDAKGPFPYASFCPMKDLMLGETAIAIGNPHGLGDTITVGVVSALGRSAKMQDGGILRNLVQTDAAINTGNSGGPLINLDGELIGINVSVLPSAKGIAFAIGADQVQAMVRKALGRAAPRNALPETGEPDEPLPAAPAPRSDGGTRAGLPTPQVSTPLRPNDFGLDVRDDGRRIVVRRVAAGSSAAVAGVAVGDALVSVDGHSIEDETDLLLAFSATEPGRVYSLLARRGAEERRFLLVTPR
jgi:S1-C subfamily serine protease